MPTTRLATCSSALPTFVFSTHVQCAMSPICYMHSCRVFSVLHFLRSVCLSLHCRYSTPSIYHGRFVIHFDKAGTTLRVLLAIKGFMGCIQSTPTVNRPLRPLPNGVATTGRVCEVGNATVCRLRRMPLVFRYLWYLYNKPLLGAAGAPQGYSAK